MSNLDPTQTVINSLNYNGNLYVGMGDYRVFSTMYLTLRVRSARISRRYAT